MGLTVAGFAVAYTLASLTGAPGLRPLRAPGPPAHRVPRAPHCATRGASTRGAQRRGASWAGVAVVLLAVLGFAYTADSASFDATRWKVAEAVVRQGYKPMQVGGGFEWLGWHRQYGPQFRWEGAKINAEKLGFALAVRHARDQPARRARRKGIVAQGDVLRDRPGTARADRRASATSSRA